MQVNAATVTDIYWIKPLDSELVYADVKFDNDYFSNLALRGTYDSFNRAANSKHSKTPELTDKIIQDVLSKLNMRVKTQFIVDYVMARYNQIEK